MAPSGKPGLIARLFRWLFSPSARWSVFALVLVGLVLGAVSVIGTQVAVAATGTNEFCGTACHSHTQFVYPEYKASVHGTNRTGQQTSCSDCHIPHSYPAKLFYKAKAGIKDGIAGMQGTISTKEKFEAKRWEMANHVWDEMRANNSANCRSCHTPEAMNTAKQSEDAVKQHKKFASGKATCIDCHTGVAHVEPTEPTAAPATPAKPAGATQGTPPTAADSVALAAPASAGK
jgi:nitrate/TMAO reductase-like tetraheme cytochrome c subunit